MEVFILWRLASLTYVIVIRNGQTVTMKKGGAGHANWGIKGDEVPDLYEYAHQDAEETTKADKVKLVDADTFKSMRS